MMTVWRLRPGADKRIRSGHPWVFSNELSASPKGHPAGTPVELQDSKGQFLARGYGNPHSLIAFRALSFNSQDKEPTSFDFLHEKIFNSWRVRKAAGFRGSFRLAFGESDFIPGLVLDYYMIEQNGKKAQLFAAQLVTAGMNEALKDAEGFFKGLAEKAHAQGLSEFSWEQTAVVIRNDVGVRKLEGAKFTGVSKKLLVDFEVDLKGRKDKKVQNFESLSWGPKLSDGRRSLLVMSDNNFSKKEITELVVFAVEGE